MTPQAVRGKAYFIGDPPVTIGAEPRDRYAVALDRLLGTRVQMLERACEANVFSDRTQARLRVAEQRHVQFHRELPGLRANSFMEIWEALGGEMSSWPVHARESQTSIDFANLLGNVLNRRLLASYSEADFGERSLMRPGVARDLRDQRAVGTDSAPDVPALDPEVSDYTELTKLAERVMPFSMLQKGVILTISRKAIINNDVDVVQRLVDGLGVAARRTMARQVWNLWISNTAYSPDATAWFHSSHGNLQSGALAEAEVIAAIRKLLDMTMPGNNERMGTRVRPGSLWLTVPHALWDAAYDLNQTQGSALFHLFGAENQYVLVNPLATDANDWGVHRDSREVESIRVNFLDGREEPQFFIADIPNADQLLLGDKILYKLRHEYGVGLVEYRGAVKAVVA